MRGEVSIMNEEKAWEEAVRLARIEWKKNRIAALEGPAAIIEYQEKVLERRRKAASSEVLDLLAEAGRYVEWDEARTLELDRSFFGRLRKAVTAEISYGHTEDEFEAWQQSAPVFNYSKFMEELETALKLRNLSKVLECVDHMLSFTENLFRLESAFRRVELREFFTWSIGSSSARLKTWCEERAIESESSLESEEILSKLKNLVGVSSMETFIPVLTAALQGAILDLATLDLPRVPDDLAHRVGQ